MTNDSASSVSDLSLALSGKRLPADVSHYLMFGLQMKAFINHHQQ